MDNRLFGVFKSVRILGLKCIAITTDKAISEKEEALREVIYHIHRAGRDIEAARLGGDEAMTAISDMIRKHIPEHNQDANIRGLHLDLNVINCKSLNPDKAGLKQPIDIEEFAGFRATPRRWGSGVVD